VLSALVAVVLLAGGAALLTAGAEAFAENVGAASARLGVSVLALGLLLAGAEPEEAVTGMLASGQAHPALAAGDAVGANLVIATLTLGLAGLVTRLRVDRHAQQYAVGAVVAGAAAWLLMLNGVLGRAEGLLLVLLYAAGVAWVWRRERQPPLLGELGELADEGTVPGLSGSAAVRSGEGGPGPRAAADDRVTGRALLMLLLGVVGMVLGGALAVRGASGLVDVLDLGESVIGLTILALATSAEMIALVWSARRRGLSDLVVAGVVGALAYNSTVTLGLAALVSPLLLGTHNVILRVAALTAVLPLALLSARRSGVLPRTVALLLVVVYVAVTAWLLAR
jgi:cation:H+ antiporter